MQNSNLIDKKRIKGILNFMLNSETMRNTKLDKPLKGMLCSLLLSFFISAGKIKVDLIQSLAKS